MVSKSVRTKASSVWKQCSDKFKEKSPLAHTPTYTKPMVPNFIPINCWAIKFCLVFFQGTLASILELVQFPRSTLMTFFLTRMQIRLKFNQWNSCESKEIITEKMDLTKCELALTLNNMVCLIWNLVVFLEYHCYLVLYLVF